MAALNSDDAAERSDADLLARTRAGDDSAFGELWARHAHAARIGARRITSAIDPDDLVSEAFACVFKIVRAGAGPEAAFRPYLFTVIRNLAQAEGNKRRRVVPTAEIETHLPPEEIPDPAVAALDQSLVSRAYACLPERWQAVLWHTEIEGLKPGVVAPLLGISANSVAALAYRAREALRGEYLRLHVGEHPLDAECEWVVSRLGKWARGKLAPADARRIGGHLPVCERCARAAAEVADVGGCMRAVVAPLVLGAAAAGYLKDTASAGAASRPFASVGKSITTKIVAGAVAIPATAVAVVTAALLTGTASTPPPAAIAGSGSPGVSAHTPYAESSPLPSQPSSVATILPRAELPPAAGITAEEPRPTSKPPAPPEIEFHPLGSPIQSRDAFVQIQVSPHQDGPVELDLDLKDEELVTAPTRPWSCLMPATKKLRCEATGTRSGQTLTAVIGVKPNGARLSLSAIATAQMTATGRDLDVALPNHGLAVRTAWVGNGHVTRAGNTLLTCDEAVVACRQTLSGDTRTPLLNDTTPQTTIDTDDDTSTRISSGARLGVDVDDKIIWAGLYWSASLDDDTAPYSTEDALMRGPTDTAYTPVVATDLAQRTDPQGRHSYQAFAEVTSFVQGHPPGTWFVADAHTGTGVRQFAGWTLVVIASSDAHDTPQLIGVYDGFVPVDPAHGLHSSFGVPAIRGTSDIRVRTTLFEGDAGLPGDSLQIDGVNLTSTTDQTDNIANSSLRDAAPAAPTHPYSLGMDTDSYTATVPIGETSAHLTATTSHDHFFLGLITTEARLAKP